MTLSATWQFLTRLNLISAAPLQTQDVGQARPTKLPGGHCGWDDHARGTTMETTKAGRKHFEFQSRVFSFLDCLLAWPHRLCLWVLSLLQLSTQIHSNSRNREATMGRQRDKVLREVVSSFARGVTEAADWIFSSSLETAVGVSNGSSVANPITCETADYGTPASQADELSMEIAMPVEEFSETADYASQADELSMGTAMPAEEFSGITEAENKAVVDEGLMKQPTPRHTNPTTVILPKINMEFAIEYKNSVLYEKQSGKWVAEPLPEKPVERVAPTVPTYPNNGVLDFKRIAS